MLRKSA
jgi:hypothetical protein